MLNLLISQMVTSGCTPMD